MQRAVYVVGYRAAPSPVAAGGNNSASRGTGVRRGRELNPRGVHTYIPGGGSTEYVTASRGRPAARGADSGALEQGACGIKTRVPEEDDDAPRLDHCVRSGRGYCYCA